MKICKCGRKLVKAHNSTMYRPCPTCQLKNALKTQKMTVKAFKTSKKGLKSLAMQKADIWFSRYIRIKYAYQITTVGEVICKCIITGTLKEAKRMDNGHCFSRGNKATRYEEDNCRPQNRSSNRFSGEADHYKFIDNLKAEIGDKRFARIDQLRRETGEDNEAFYFEQAQKYRVLVNEMVKKQGVRKWW